MGLLYILGVNLSNVASQRRVFVVLLEKVKDLVKKLTRRLFNYSPNILVFIEMDSGNSGERVHL
jgi:hypothetical protein